MRELFYTGRCGKSKSTGSGPGYSGGYSGDTGLNRDHYSIALSAGGLRRHRLIIP